MTSLLPYGAPGNPEPLYYTKRNPHRDTVGPDMARTLARCQKQLIVPMPWQHEFFNIAGELGPDGKLWYRTIILILPRQGGKTTLVRGRLAWRGITHNGAQMLYTAQDRGMARKRMEKTIYEPLRDSAALGKYMARPRWSPGSEVVRWRNGSELRTTALSETGAHGDTLDDAFIDEAFAHKDNRIEQNVSPTLITVQGSQKIIFSAAGNELSTFLMGKRDKGRELVKLGKDSRTMYVEYSAPLDADPNDPATYLACHPAIGHTIQLEDVIDERDNMDAEEFNRAYLGWWPVSKKAESPIPLAAWRENYVDELEQTWHGKPLWCIDVSPDRTWASIGLAAKSFDPDARAFLEVIDHEQGAAWVLGRLVDLANRFGGKRVAIDATGAAASLKIDLEARGFEVYMVQPRERVMACNALHDDVLQNKVKYLDDPVLTGAMVSATKLRTAGGEAWVFSRGKSQADITPLYAVALARYAFTTLPAEYDVFETIA